MYVLSFINSEQLQLDVDMDAYLAANCVTMLTVTPINCTSMLGEEHFPQQHTAENTIPVK